MSKEGQFITSTLNALQNQIWNPPFTYFCLNLKQLWKNRSIKLIVHLIQPINHCEFLREKNLCETTRVDLENLLKILSNLMNMRTK